MSSVGENNRVENGTQNGEHKAKAQAKKHKFDQAYIQSIVAEFVAKTEKMAEDQKDQDEEDARLAEAAAELTLTNKDDIKSGCLLWTQDDSDKLATETEAYVAAALAKLRMVAKTKKNRTKDHVESWKFMCQKASKLTPEKAAEMARANVAAALAAEAMREPEEKRSEQTKKEHEQKNVRKEEGCESEAAKLEFLEDEDDPFGVVMYTHSCFRRDKNESSPEASIEEMPGPMPPARKRKTVEFAADTVFERRKS